uniref:Putative cytochrome P450 monooxygenase n=1 Tax=Gibberella zeae TaxID=5518 RepID=Q4W7G4_GIBZA|nr:putative cytochrome P450 monooxygenase [Fusarium graminearum]
MISDYLQLPKGYEIPILFLTPILLNFVGTILYNVFFHPLAAVPGPLACKVSRAWLYLAERGGDGANTVAALHKRYGPLVRIGPNEVSIKDREAFVTINKQGSRFLKDPAFYDAFSSNHGNLFTFSNVDEHSKRKRLMSPSFSRASTEQHDAIVHATITPLVEEVVLSVRKGESIDLYSVMRRFAIKSIISFCYGNNSICPDYVESVIPKLFQVLDESPKDLLVLQHFPLLRKSLTHLATVFPQLFPESIKFLQMVGMELLSSSRNSSSATQPGLFKEMQTLLKVKDQSLTDDELIAESSTMFFAGTDTTATTVSVALWHLIHQPDDYARLQDELRTIMPDVNSGPSLRELESLPFLEACIKESLRLACPVRGRLPRIVPPEGLEVNGFRIPARTVVSSCISYMTYDEEVFPEPWKFRPGRWLQENNKDLDGFLYPFSRGTRSCIGQSLSLAEQRVAISQMVRRFSPRKGMQFREIVGKEYVTYVIEDKLPVMLEEAK